MATQSYKASSSNSKIADESFKSNFIEIKTESTPILGDYTVYEPVNGKYENLVLAKETRADNELEFNDIKNLLVLR